MTLDVSTLYVATGTAKLADLPAYEARVRELVPPGADVTLTGPGPVWLYLRLAHRLHGRVRILTYTSPVSGPVEIFNHNPG
ncbi:MAG: CRISPR-associated protein Csx3 [Verrucomicrobiae bacterium]|nr:CRISPR-associated protein Csx3 [Verrucomicrobiae bacterium]